MYINSSSVHGITNESIAWKLSRNLWPGFLLQEHKNLPHLVRYRYITKVCSQLTNGKISKTSFCTLLKNAGALLHILIKLYKDHLHCLQYVTMSWQWNHFKRLNIKWIFKNNNNSDKERYQICLLFSTIFLYYKESSSSSTLPGYGSFSVYTMHAIQP